MCVYFIQLRRDNMTCGYCVGHLSQSDVNSQLSSQHTGKSFGLLNSHEYKRRSMEHKVYCEWPWMWDNREKLFDWWLSFVIDWLCCSTSAVFSTLVWTDESHVNIRSMLVWTGHCHRKWWFYRLLKIGQAPPRTGNTSSQEKEIAPVRSCCGF